MLTVGRRAFVAYAHITEFDFDDDRNTVNYDALSEIRR